MPLAWAAAKALGHQQGEVHDLVSGQVTVVAQLVGQRVLTQVPGDVCGISMDDVGPVKGATAIGWPSSRFVAWALPRFPHRACP